MITQHKQLGRSKVIFQNSQIFSSFEAVKVGKPRKNGHFLKILAAPDFFSNWIFYRVLSYSLINDKECLYRIKIEIFS